MASSLMRQMRLMPRVARHISTSRYSHQHLISSSIFSSSRIPLKACSLFTSRMFCSEVPLVKRRLQIAFTCKVCSTRSTKEMSAQAYYHGVVLIQCPGCHNRHLIADHLGWFESYKTIEEAMDKAGEKVKRVDDNNVFELTEEQVKELAVDFDMKAKLLSKEEEESVEKKDSKDS